MADDGGLVEGDNGDASTPAKHLSRCWGLDLLIVADDLLHNRINDLPQLTSPAQATVLGLHPHADGDLRGPKSRSLLEGQPGALQQHWSAAIKDRHGQGCDAVLYDMRA